MSLIAAFLSPGGALLAAESVATPYGPTTSEPTRSASGVHSAEILRADEPLYQRPDRRAKRRGAAALGAHLPVFEAVEGPGCRGRWLSVGPLAWVCEDVVRASSLEPLKPTAHIAPPSADGLPYRYYFVGNNGTLGYRNLSTAEQGFPDAELEPDFILAIREIRTQLPGDPFGLTTHELWVPMRDLAPVGPVSFRGSELDPDHEVAWVIHDNAPAYAEPGGWRVVERYSRLTPVEVTRTQQVRGRYWLQVGDRWLKQQDLASRTQAPPPAGLQPKERWIDVDLEKQIATAFEGDRPVYATLISSGRGAGDAEDATPKGEHRIWVKLRSSDMDNLENPEAGRYYAIQSVPWVMYFKRGYGLHGTFWHHQFGQVHSHGCVNLSPLDAHWIFAWTSPRMPAGWTAVFPTEYDTGTLVRVR